MTRTPQRKIIAFLAASADGYIARPDGDIDWLNRIPRKSDYGMREFHAGVDTILMGRGTYDWGIEYFRKTGKPPRFDASPIHYVFSRNPPKEPAPGATFVSEDVTAFAERLRAAPGKHIWMMGGGGLIASFLDAEQIDEFDIHLMPVLIGEGIPIVAPRHRHVPLKLIDSKKYPDGVVRVRYAVARKSSGKRIRAPGAVIIRTR